MIQNPSYPIDDHGVECSWVIYAPENYHVLLVFDAFNISDDDFDCSGSYLKVKDKMPSETVVTYCNDPPLSALPVESSASVMVVTFHSIKYNPSAKMFARFSARYKAVPAFVGE